MKLINLIIQEDLFQAFASTLFQQLAQYEQHSYRFELTDNIDKNKAISTFSRRTKERLQNFSMSIDHH